MRRRRRARRCAAPPQPPPRRSCRPGRQPAPIRALESSLFRPPLTPVPSQDCPLVAADLARLAAGTPFPKPDTSRYRLEPPGEGAAPEAWQAALDNARAQLEHQSLRIQNLELLGKYGANSWLAHNRSLEAACVQQEKEGARLAAALSDLHKTRKVQQTAAGLELRKMEAEWRALVAQNAAIEAACAELVAAAAAAPAAAAA